MIFSLSYIAKSTRRDMSKFVKENCDIPTLWCGDSAKPPKKSKDGSYYYKTGTRRECLSKGFGAGTHIERKANLPVKSLQQIKYVGEKHEKDFKKAGITSTDDLVKQLGKKTTKEMENILKRILVKTDKKLDARAYNSTILYLYSHGIGGVPACSKIKPKE